ncbi:MAG: hypothetical protein LBL21_03625 [Rickettsiales bacterium]|jgi:hypothetical protein|nr:hypothetical protein [Rickettsiales bacterium]
MIGKILFFGIILFSGGAYADSCPSGFSEDAKLVFVGDTDSCPPGYSETSDYAFADDGAACPPGYSDAGSYVIQSNTGTFSDTKGDYQYACTGTP